MKTERSRFSPTAITTICQHEAVLFGVADLEKPEFAVLKESIISRFGVNGDSSGLPEDFEPLDLFIGFAIRVLVMQKLGLYRQNLEEIKALYGSMALKTGTIWEHRAGYAEPKPRLRRIHLDRDTRHYA